MDLPSLQSNPCKLPSESHLGTAKPSEFALGPQDRTQTPEMHEGTIARHINTSARSVISLQSDPCKMPLPPKSHTGTAKPLGFALGIFQ